MLGTTTRLSMLLLGLWLHLRETFFLGLGLTVTEITVKKVQKQDLKKHSKCKKDVGMAYQKYANKVGMIYRIILNNLYKIK